MPAPESRIPAASSSHVLISFSPTRTMRSPAFSPARAAGVSGITSPIFGVRVGIPPRKMPQNTRKAKKRFPIGPAATIAIFTQTGFW